MTNRQLQAKNTRDKIFNAAIEIMEQIGFDKVTIEQICEKANVSVGSFYNHFKSKDEIVIEMYGTIDFYFRDEVEPLLIHFSVYDKIITYFAHYARYVVKTGLDYTKRLFGNYANKVFKDRRWDMHAIFRRILDDARSANMLADNKPPEEIEEFLFVLVRGVVSDWCLCDGGYDLESRVVEYVKTVLPLFLRIEKTNA